MCYEKKPAEHRGVFNIFIWHHQCHIYERVPDWERLAKYWERQINIKAGSSRIVTYFLPLALLWEFDRQKYLSEIYFELICNKKKEFESGDEEAWYHPPEMDQSVRFSKKKANEPVIVTFSRLIISLGHSRVRPCFGWSAMCGKTNEIISLGLRVTHPFPWISHLAPHQPGRWYKR